MRFLKTRPTLRKTALDCGRLRLTATYSRLTADSQALSDSVPALSSPLVALVQTEISRVAGS